MKYYIKEAAFAFIYMIFTDITAVCVLFISEELLWVRILLAVLNLVLYAAVVAAASYKEGQTSVKVRAANDLEREIIVKTGEDRPLKLLEEYKPYKGFLIGFITCIPLLILLALHAVFYFAADYKTLGGIGAFLYFTFYVFFSLNRGTSATEITTTSNTAWYNVYGSLIAIPIVMLITGVSYLLGARKIIKQQEMIKEKQKSIYGE